MRSESGRRAVTGGFARRRGAERTAARPARAAGSLVACLALLAAGLAAPDRAHAQIVCTPNASNPVVRFQTSLGDFEVTLCADPADGVETTVNNFLGYVDRGDYTDNGIVHRVVVSGPQNMIDVVQGGGAWFDAGGVMRLVPEQDPIVLQAGLQNLRGTIAMARTNEEDSATSQWYLNVQDNPGLDPFGSNPGFAVFGEVSLGMAVVDAIHALPLYALNGGFLAEVPLDGYPDDGSSPLPHFVYVTDVSRVPEPAAALQAGAGLLAIAALAARRRRRRAR